MERGDVASLTEGVEDQTDGMCISFLYIHTSILYKTEVTKHFGLKCQGLRKNMSGESWPKYIYNNNNNNKACNMLKGKFKM